jgi:FkbM family methyltransferase
VTRQGTPAALLDLPLGLKVALPDSNALITPYVLREQGDWFEDEIAFVRRAVQAGEEAVDVGANYGLYALTLAKLVGPEGRVLAFEPAPQTASFLRESIRENGLPWLSLEECALSDHEGEGRLFLHAQSELNSLHTEGGGGAQAVALRTLNERTWAAGLSDEVSFVKLDAEGEEARILDGGRRFLTRTSPLVMFELRHGQQVGGALPGRFACLGYRLYRLLPGAGVLVPLGQELPQDPYALNAFACKAGRALELERRGLLALGLHLGPLRVTPQQHLALLPFAEEFLPELGGFDAGRVAGAGEHERAIALFAASQEQDREPGERSGLLLTALGQSSRALCGPQPVARLQTFARIARAAGERRAAVEALKALLGLLTGEEAEPLDEPFLPVSQRFEAVPPRGRHADWLLASTLEELEKLSAFSSFYAPPEESLARLMAIERLGFGSEEMARRLSLVRAAATK